MHELQVPPMLISLNPKMWTSVHPVGDKRLMQPPTRTNRCLLFQIVVTDDDFRLSLPSAPPLIATTPSNTSDEAASYNLPSARRRGLYTTKTPPSTSGLTL
ncbi:hypothetical protein VNI00_015339 [Paramarasmius palmivorus]|uniref:Uncharacterized protein n=1 Tax=Paramarasmius palmivorus TaxID=297713 RepID=A0AAW0BLA9_9AGAR